MLADLLLMVPAQRMVTERDINAQVCGNHMPACNWSQLHTLMYKPTIWELIE